jgi:hypothetical protein
MRTDPEERIPTLRIVRDQDAARVGPYLIRFERIGSNSRLSVWRDNERVAYVDHVEVDSCG